MDNNFKPIPPESEFASSAVGEEAEIYTPPVVAKEQAPTPEPKPVDFEPAAPAKKTYDFAAIFSQPLYLAICILVTVLTAIQFIASGFQLLTLLFMIAGWVTFGKAKKKESPLSGIKFTHGVLVAKYVLQYIAGGMLILAGLGLVSLHFTTGVTFESLLEQAYNGTAQIGSLPYVGDTAKEVLVSIMNAYHSAISSVNVVGIDAGAMESIIFISVAMCIALAGAIVLLFNILYTRRLCIFTKSIGENIQDPNAEILKARAVKNWLMVMGVLTAIGVLNLKHFVTIGVSAAILICGSIFVKNNFVEEK